MNDGDTDQKVHIHRFVFRFQLCCLFMVTVDFLIAWLVFYCSEKLDGKNVIANYFQAEKFCMLFYHL